MTSFSSYNPYLVHQGEYSLAPLTRKAQELKEAGFYIINLTIGDPTEDTYEAVRLSIAEQMGLETISQYPSSLGAKSYLESACTWAKKHHNINLIPYKEVISCNGTKEVIFSIPLLFDWSNGKKIFFQSMSYPVYASSAAINKIPVQVLPVSEATNFFPNLDSISKEEWLTCQAFWLNSPNNPTSSIASKEYLEKLLKLAEKYNFIVCADECYNDIYYQDKPVSCLDFPDSEHWVVFRSLSKRSHMTGFRTGVVISKNQTLMKYLGKLRPPMGVGTPTFIQKAATKAWLDEEHVQKNLEQYKQKNALLKKSFIDKGFRVYGGNASFYIWFSHPKLKTSKEIFDLFLKNHLLITPGTAFGSDGEGFARMVYCVTLDTCKEAAQYISKMII